MKLNNSARLRGEKSDRSDETPGRYRQNLNLREKMYPVMEEENSDEDRQEP